MMAIYSENKRLYSKKNSAILVILRASLRFGLTEWRGIPREVPGPHNKSFKENGT